MKTENLALDTSSVIKLAQEVNRKITTTGVIKSISNIANRSEAISNFYASISPDILSKWVFDDFALDTPRVMVKAMNNMLSSDLDAFSALSSLAKKLRSSFAVSL